MTQSTTASIHPPWPPNDQVTLAARFNALGGLKTSDPLGRAFWTAGKICPASPDFIGFLVKANSQGQPGPQDYGRRHADGANMLAESLVPDGGVVKW